MKKFLLMFLALLVLFSSLAFSVSAESTAQEVWDSNFVNPAEIKYPMSVSDLLACAGELGLLHGDKIFLYHSSGEDYGGTRYRDVYYIYTSADPDCNMIYDSISNTFTFNGTCYGGAFQTDYNHVKGEFTSYHPKLVNDLGNVNGKSQRFFKFNSSTGITLFRNDFDVIDSSTGESLDGTGNIESPEEFFYDITYDENYNCNIQVSTTGAKQYGVQFELVNHSDYHLNFDFFNNQQYYFLSSSTPTQLTFSVKDLYDSLRDNPHYSDDLVIKISVYSGFEDFNRKDIDAMLDFLHGYSIWDSISSDIINMVDFHAEKINVSDILNNDYSLFSEKKDYISLPSLDDYIEDFPDFPEWDSEHPLDSIWNVVKWVGDCLVIVGKNLIGFFKWLGACLVTFIENIGIALYNLVVDLRRLLIYLFKPSENFFSNEISKYKKIFGDKFSAIETLSDYFDTLKNNLLGDSSAPEWTFIWKDKELLAVDFSMFDKYRNTIHNVILAIAWTLFLKYIYKSLPSLISSMPN